jgi:CRISPR-associated protein Cmr1
MAYQPLKLTVTLETVTPLFLGGAEQQPELRPAPFKGMLRYWWRALAGRFMGVERLRQEEARIFGSTDSASPVILRVEGKPLWGDIKGKDGPGYRYLLWSFILQRKGRDIPALLPGTEIKLGLSLRPSPKPVGAEASPRPYSVLWDAGFALWLLVHLGGIGARSRRLFGSLRVKEVSSIPLLEKPLPPFDGIPETLDELAAHLESGLKVIVNGFGKAPLSGFRPSFHVLHPRHCSIWVVANRTWMSWESAVEEIGSNFASFRRSLGRARERIILGLPIRGVKTKYERYASPLMLTLTPLKEHLACVAVMFRPLLGKDSDPHEIVTSFVRQFEERRRVQL